MINAILGRKLGMTRIFNEKNEVVPVTVVEAGPCKVAQVKNVNMDGYNAVQICFGRKKLRNITKPLLGHLKKHKVDFYPEKIREIRVGSVDGINPGDEVNISIFSVNELVDVQGYTKGKGFAGVVKRWGFGGGPRTHGQSDRLRAPGSIGSQRPQRVPKGRKMAGHLGNELVTVKNLQIVRIDTENNLLFIKGALPGNKNSIVLIKKTGKVLKPKQEVSVEKTKGKK
ncbi:MAG: 50S ribosomal protein L3 [Endomicrobia bacterium]|nr:50S ribosomal protein L3 [Endomicrobiia bacterium]MCX7941390.1 50S ribosomal protein L3 [Endomicrobiia bacterium]MDW8055506.1 50S ribosomal protein L3 [Elusimicrobiota bacterium]